MVQSDEILEKLQMTLPVEVWCAIQSAIPDITPQNRRKSQKNILREINKIIINTSLNSNNATLLNALPEITDDETEDLFFKVMHQYINTKDDQWLNSIFSISEKMSKKSDQSRIFAKMARDLIDTGVSRSIPKFIQDGMQILQRISFRKYRSEIMIDIIPLLIVWAITTRSKELIYTSLELIEEIGDISKRAVLHSELAKALATIALLEKDRSSFFNSIKTATSIHQKNRRHDCLAFIIEKGSRSVFGKEMADVPSFIVNFQEVPRDAYLEIIGALTEQMLDRIKDKNQVLKTLEILCQADPDVTVILVLDLLKKAERSGDPWYFSAALNLQTNVGFSESHIYRELVRAGIAVAKNTKDMQVLLNLIPIIEKNADTTTASRTFLQFSEMMLDYKDFKSALIIFKKIRRDMKTTTGYSDVMTHLIREGILDNQVAILNSSLLKEVDEIVVNSTIPRAITELCKETTLDDVIQHIPSIKEILLLHPEQNQILLDCVTLLADRGFLDTGDPGILISLAESITDVTLRERAISLIVIKIARIGVHARNRDMLQRAVGLSCAIEGQNTRSAALSNIIDEAAILAAQQGDLDLLLRMKVWSSSLLEPTLATFALSNIIDGIIRYALNQQSVAALEEATRIAQEVNDPSLRIQTLEKIAEGFVTTGCILLQDPHYLTNEDRLSSVIYPFTCAIEIIKNNSNSSQVSLKIASFIDIILSYSQSSDNPDYTIILALYASEISNTYEQDAMMARIVSGLQDNIPHHGSTDPYDIITNHLFRNQIVKTNPVALDLLHRIILKIQDRYIRLSNLCTLAIAIIKTGDENRARQLLHTITEEVESLTLLYQKVLTLADLATIYAEFDSKTATKYIDIGISLLDQVEPNRSSEVCHQMVLAIIRMNSILPDKKWSWIALDIIHKITNPVDYISSLTAVYNMFRHDKQQCDTLLQTMAAAVDRINSPYDQATTIMDIIPLALANENIELLKQLLIKAENILKKINIQYISDTIKVNLAEIYLLLYKKLHEMELQNTAIRIIRTIDNDEVRIHQFQLAGLDDSSDETARYLRIKNAAEKTLRDTPQSNQIAILEHLVQSISDRGKEALFFCDLSIFFKRSGNVKLSQKMIQSSLKAAKIIRPLSRRSHVMCDIALKNYASGNHDTAQEILDFAIDAATNIRQASVRDEVFEELGLAIKIMQGL